MKVASRGPYPAPSWHADRLARLAAARGGHNAARFD